MADDKMEIVLLRSVYGGAEGNIACSSAKPRRRSRRRLISGGWWTCSDRRSLLVDVSLAAFGSAGCPPTAMLPLWPRPSQPAKLLLLRGVKGSRAAFRALPGLVLHSADMSLGAHYTAEAEAVLRGGAALAL